MATSKIESASLASDAVDNTNIDSTLITAQTEKTTLVDADKFLISDSAASGAFKYVQKSNLPSGNWVRLGGTDATGLSDITYDLFSSTYQVYKIIGSHTVSNNNAETHFRIRKSGSDQTNSHYRWAYNEAYISGSGGADGHNVGWNLNYCRITKGSSNNVAHPTAFELIIFSPTDSTRQSACLLHSCFFEAGGNDKWHGWNGSVWLDSTTGVDITGIKIYPASGTITNAKYSIYALKDS